MIHHKLDLVASHPSSASIVIMDATIHMESTDEYVRQAKQEKIDKHEQFRCHYMSSAGAKSFDVQPLLLGARGRADPAAFNLLSDTFYFN